MALHVFCYSAYVNTHTKRKRKVNELKNKTEARLEHYSLTTFLLFLQSYHSQKRLLIGMENWADGDDCMHPQFPQSFEMMAMPLRHSRSHLAPH